MLVKKKKMCYNVSKVKRKGERSYDVGTRVYTIYDFLLF